MRGRGRVEIALRVDALGALIVAQTGASYVNVEWHMPVLPPVAEQTEQRVAEGLSEVPIEVRIDQRIERGIEVANPEEYGDHNIWHLAGITGHGERVPASTRKIQATYKKKCEICFFRLRAQ